MFRQTWLTETIVELTDTLVSDYDLVEFLEHLTARCVELVDATEVGIMLRDEEGTLHAVTSSTGQMQALELQEMQNQEGPSFDCVASGKRVDAVLLGDETLARWPTFHPAAFEAGYRQVLALPMRLRDETIGAVSIFCRDPREDLPEADLSLAQSFADLATIAILQERATSDAQTVVNQLQFALDSRVVIEQAKGMLALHNGIPVDEAYTLLRSEARSQNRRLTDVAHSIVTAGSESHPDSPASEPSAPPVSADA